MLEKPLWCRPYAYCSKFEYILWNVTNFPKISYGNIIPVVYLKAYETYPTKKFFTISRISTYVQHCFRTCFSKATSEIFNFKIQYIAVMFLHWRKFFLPKWIIRRIDVTYSPLCLLRLLPSIWHDPVSLFVIYIYCCTVIALLLPIMILH